MRRIVHALVGLTLVASWVPATPAATTSDPGTSVDASTVGLAGLTAPFRAVPTTTAGSKSNAGWFANYDTGFDAAEPTLAVLKDDTIVTQSWTETIRSTDLGDSWEVVHTAPTAGTTLDPYIHADAETGRILASQLLGACQMLSISDDAGETWIDAPTQCPSGDHQKIGSGPWHDPSNKLYPRAFYTCLNKVIDTACSMSYDGGLTWGPQVIVFPGVDTSAERYLNAYPLCGGLEGDPVSGPDGTIYVPREYCGRPFLGVSKDDGLTWTRHWVAEPAQTSPVGYGANNPSVYVDPAGTVYYAWTGDDWSHYVAYSKDQGATWSKQMKVSPAGIGTTTLPMIIAGKAGRVATAFIGTSEGPTNPGDVGKDAVWHLYLSYSMDANTPKAHWKTIRVSEHPIRIGCVGRHGGETGCTYGGLLDFNDIAFLEDGRLAMSYTDACPEACEKPETPASDRLVIAIQTRGPSFFK